tara:strand:- start:751 stop:870 length:120 start_codon:yes stop_codon:yes gene_type:complete
MTMFHGLGMFIFGMFAIFVGAIIAYFIINKIMKDENDGR